jgi:Holliday junction resolvasome RuvABC endonuclease subunit
MNFLSLDLGSKTGFGILKDGNITIGTKKLRHDRNASGIRALDFHRWLTQMIREHSIDRVYFERVYVHSGTEAAHLYGYFMHTLAAVCEEYGIKCTGISVGTIKKFATGNGHATKEEMMNFARRSGFNPIDDNAADGLAILLIGINMLKIQQNRGPCFANEASGAATPVTSLASEIF